MILKRRNVAAARSWLEHCGGDIVLTDAIVLDDGLVHGFASHVAGVQVYRGIPFAAPASGEQRWRAPQPVRPWQGVKAATRFGDACPQPKVPTDNIMRQFSFAEPPECAQSEDCLNLNVWTGAPTVNARLPVIVWLYGGGHRLGAGSHPRSWGDRLASLGSVVVAPNYRVGALGYLAHPALTRESGSSGNYEYLDVLEALRWVRRNIAAFGGNPDCVTLYGQSAGGAIINVLLASELSRGLVHRAIICSAGRMRGGPMGVSKTLAQAEHDGERLMSELGAATTESLRTLPAQQMFGPPGSWGPIIDGHVLREPVQSVFDRGAQLAVPLLTGWTGDEALPFPLVELQTRQGLQAYAQGFGEDAAEFLRLYDASSDEAARASSYRVRSDMAFAYQPWQIARAHNRTGGRSYVFNWLHAPPLPVDAHFHQPPMPFGYGAYHGAEIWYAFGNFEQQAWAWTEADRWLAELFGRYLVSFARHGDPNAGGLPHWPPFDDGDVAMLFDATARSGVIGNREGLHFFDRHFNKTARITA